MSGMGRGLPELTRDSTLLVWVERYSTSCGKARLNPGNVLAVSACAELAMAWFDCMFAAVSACAELAGIFPSLATVLPATSFGMFFL